MTEDGGPGPGPGPGPGEDGGDSGPASTKTNPLDNQVEPEPVNVALCAQEIVGFDLSAFEPVGAEVAAAWVHARSLQTHPGLVLVLSGAKLGPVTAAMGSVHSSSAVDYEFDPAPSAATGLAVVAGGVSPFAFSIAPTPATFAASFSSTVAVGFAVAEVSVDAETDAFCNQMSGKVTLTVPETSGSANFGNGTTLAQVMGQPTHTIGAGSSPNAWQIVLTGTASNVSMRSP